MKNLHNLLHELLHELYASLDKIRKAGGFRYDGKVTILVVMTDTITLRVNDGSTLWYGIYDKDLRFPIDVTPEQLKNDLAIINAELPAIMMDYDRLKKIQIYELEQKLKTLKS